VWNPFPVPLNHHNDEGLGGFWSYFVPGLLVGMVLGALVVCFAETHKTGVFLGTTGFFAFGSGVGKDTFWQVLFHLGELLIEGLGSLW
jgi:hypothetical protein